MPIAGVVIVTTQEKSMQVLDQINEIENVTSYGIHKDNNIIAVFEGDTPKDLELISKKIESDVPGVLGIFPSYVSYEDED